MAIWTRIAIFLSAQFTANAQLLAGVKEPHVCCSTLSSVSCVNGACGSSVHYFMHDDVFTRIVNVEDWVYGFKVRWSMRPN